MTERCEIKRLYLTNVYRITLKKIKIIASTRWNRRKEIMHDCEPTHFSCWRQVPLEFKPKNIILRLLEHGTAGRGLTLSSQPPPFSMWTKRWAIILIIHVCLLIYSLHTSNTQKAMRVSWNYKCRYFFDIFSIKVQTFILGSFLFRPFLICSWLELYIKFSRLHCWSRCYKKIWRVLFPKLSLLAPHRLVLDTSIERWTYE